ncbi:MAG TPA: CRISPR-associated helicase Cas3' [Bacteroidales bacterium]|nr:CRISPR-associated helicase Cas3' [Bacteroidales bacterium]
MSYKSINEIIENSLRLFDIVGDKYLAHTSEKKKDETLKKHSKLVGEYLVKIINSQGIEILVEQIINKLAESLKIRNSSTNHYCKTIFFDAITLHDLGKINPNFQVDRMKNEAFQKQKLHQKFNHSFLGSFIFSNFYFVQVLEDKAICEDYKAFLYFFVFLMSNAINCHHSSILYYQQEFEANFLEESFRFLKEYKILLEEDYSLSFYENLKEIKEEVEMKSEIFFTFFALLKLNSSLLTTSDYYATNDYMADIKVDEFGLIDEDLRTKIRQNFKTKQPFNKDLFLRFEEYQDKPFKELQEKSKANLNYLRQKLNAEVISTFRNNPDNLWYYIEAPTGAGKTNLSLACITELLQTDKSLNKVFYVFPFTTLITQTFSGIQETIGLDKNEMIQLHSKAGFHTKEETADGEYGREKKLHLDNLFVNYPVCVTSHIRFFDILKGNHKESNYLLHRLCNSIVVIDELQTYNPKHWDKILFFIENYARLFNMRFIIMSATLPKIDALSETAKGKFVNLTPNKKLYFTNKNFSGRVEFDFSWLNKDKPDKDAKEEYLEELSLFVKKQADNYFIKYKHSRVLIEFITKNTASRFFRMLMESNDFDDFKILLLSGDILESMRKKIINDLKKEEYDKVILVSTQVIEAGVDIDMDLGFKDRSLLDSDEQLAGRINRNASKEGGKVFLFDCDNTKTIYGKDQRYKHQQKDKEIYFGFKEILQNKTFDRLYEKVFEDVKRDDWTDTGKLKSYLENFEQFNFQHIHSEFQLIENNDSRSIFIPVDIDIPDGYSKDDFHKINILTDSEEQISGEKLFETYITIIRNKDVDFIKKQIELKKITGLMSQFTLSVYPNILNEIKDKCDAEKSKYGYEYLSFWDECYDINAGFNVEKAKQDIIL